LSPQKDNITLEFTPPPGENQKQGEHQKGKKQPVRNVEIIVEGDLEKFYNNNGDRTLKSQQFTLNPGNPSVKFSYSLKSLQDLIGNKPFDEDVLYGAKITIKDSLTFDGSTTTKTTVKIPYLYLDQSDDNPIDKRLKFADTVADGDITRKRNYTDYTFSNSGVLRPEFFFTGNTTNDFNPEILGLGFNPSVEGTRTAEMKVRVKVDGQFYESSNSLTVEGESVPKQKVFLNTQGLKKVLEQLANKENIRSFYPGNIAPESRAIITPKYDTPPGITFNERAEFDTPEERETIANTVKNKIENFLAVVEPAIEFIPENEIQQTYDPQNRLPDTTAVNWSVSATDDGSWGESLDDKDNLAFENQRRQQQILLSNEFLDNQNKFGKSAWLFKLSEALNIDKTDNVYTNVDTILRELFYEGNAYDLNSEQLAQGLSEATAHELGHTFDLFHTATFNETSTLSNQEKEHQKIVLNGGDSESKFKLIFNGFETDLLPRNATPLKVQQELGKLKSIGNISEDDFSFKKALNPNATPEQVRVVGEPGNYDVFFENLLTFENPNNPGVGDIFTTTTGVFVGRNVSQIKGEGTNSLIVNVQTIKNGSNNIQHEITSNPTIKPEYSPPLGRQDLMSVNSLNISEESAKSFTNITVPILLMALNSEWNQEQGWQAFTTIVEEFGEDESSGSSGFQDISNFKEELNNTSQKANLLIDSNSQDGLQQNSEPVFNIDTPENNNFGGATVGVESDIERSIVITNDGATDLTFTPNLVTGEGDFDLGAFAGVEQTLASGESLTIPITFNPTTAGLRPGQIEFTTNDTNLATFQYGIVGTGIPKTGVELDWGRDYIGIEYDDFFQRTVSNGIGNFMFEIPTFTEYNIKAFDPNSGLIADNIGFTGPAAALTDLSSSLRFKASNAPDTDFDGLPDDIELAIGSDLELPDTDNDSLSDFVEIERGLDPLGAQRYPTGIIASLPLRGEAKGVSAVGSISNPAEQTVYVATGSYGLAIVDASGFNNPIIQGQLDLAGDATDVAVDSRLKIAAVATNSGGLQLVDVSYPMLPVLKQTININARQVEVYNGIAYATVGASLRAIDLWTGKEIQNLTLPGFGYVTGMAREGTKVYAFVSGSDTFSVIDISQQDLARVIGQQTVGVASTDVGVAVGNGVAYIVGSGFRTLDVSDPTNPRLIANPELFFSARHMALNGSGLGIVTSEDQGIGVYDLSNPQKTNKRLLRTDTPGFAYNVAIASGLAYVADSNGGLQVVNYLPFDNKGQKPAVSISSSIDSDPNTEGKQVIEGRNIPLQINLADDVQVRNVEFLVNGEVVNNDVSFPFDSNVVAPKITNASNTVEIQVRATDTGGNIALSNSLNFQILPDPIPPQILSIKPNYGAESGVGLQTVEINFAEALAVDTVNIDTFKLVNSQGNFLTLENIQLRNDDRLVQLAFKPLPEGSYQLIFDAPKITDRVGNPLGTNNIVSNFTLKPTKVELKTTVADINPNKPGFQVSEGANINFQTQLFEPNGVRVKSVEFLVNGKVLGNDISSPFTFSTTAPKITAEFNTLTVQARGTDTNNFVSVSQPLVIELVDITPPTIASFKPTATSAGTSGTKTINVTFSEFIKPETLNEGTIQLFDNNNNLLTIQSIKQSNSGKTVEISFEPLAAGNYRLEMKSNQITDLSGNKLGTSNVVHSFTLKPIEVTLSSLDLQPEIPGIQATESSIIPINANIVRPGDTQVKKLELLVDGQLIESDTTSPFKLSPLNISSLGLNSDNFTLQTRVVDSNDAAFYSQIENVNLVADIFGPRIAYTVPDVYDFYGRRTVEIAFNESLSANSAVIENFQLFNSANNLVQPLSFEANNNGQLVKLNYNTLLPGAYKLSINAPVIVDSLGNIMGNELITKSFDIYFVD
jgi:hypothetical protein